MALDRTDNSTLGHGALTIDMALKIGAGHQHPHVILARNKYFIISYSGLPREMSSHSTVQLVMLLVVHEGVQQQHAIIRYVHLNFMGADLIKESTTPPTIIIVLNL